MSRLFRSRKRRKKREASESYLDEERPWTDHLAELRNRLIRVLLVFAAAFFAGITFSEQIVQWLKMGVQVQVNWNVFSPTDALRVWIQVAFMTSLLAVLPYIMFELWGFVSPGLKKKERRATLHYIPASAIMFAVGIAFAYFVLFPMILQFMQNLAQRLGATEMYGVAQYFQFMFHFILPFGLLFEMPVVLLFLTRLELVSPQRLARMRKYAYFVLLVIAALITPPDIVSHLLVTLPLIFLYEVSLLLSAFAFRRKERERRIREATGTPEAEKL